MLWTHVALAAGGGIPTHPTALPATNSDDGTFRIVDNQTIPLGFSEWRDGQLWQYSAMTPYAGIDYLRASESRWVEPDPSTELDLIPYVDDFALIKCGFEISGNDQYSLTGDGGPMLITSRTSGQIQSISAGTMGIPTPWAL